MESVDARNVGDEADDLPGAGRDGDDVAADRVCEVVVETRCLSADERRRVRRLKRNEESERRRTRA